MIQTSVKDGFLELFYHDIRDLELARSNKLNLFTLKIANNSFSYEELVIALSNQLYHFALSRTEVAKLINDGQFGSLVRKAQEKLRNHSSNDGELGEILLYCFLESHLNAPKILTKLELKTAANNYVHGADGVHLLRLDKSSYQLVLGESKLWSNLSDGIKDAFDSIEKFLNSDKKNFEVGLISSQLVKETYDDDLYDFLKKVIIPSAKDDEIYTDISFAIFLGFNIGFSEEELELKNKEFRENCREKVQEEVKSVTEKLNKFINDSKFSGYDFYVYTVPFTDLKKTRKELIKMLEE